MTDEALRPSQRALIMCGIGAMSITAASLLMAPHLAFTWEAWRIGLEVGPVIFISELFGSALVIAFLGWLFALLFKKRGSRVFLMAWSLTTLCVAVVAVISKTLGPEDGGDPHAGKDLALAKYAVLPVTSNCDYTGLDYQRARGAGVNDIVLAQHLSEETGVRVSGALRDGWTYDEIVRELSANMGAYCRYSKSIGN